MSMRSIGSIWQAILRGIVRGPHKNSASVELALQAGPSSGKHCRLASPPDALRRAAAHSADDAADARAPKARRRGRSHTRGKQDDAKPIARLLERCGWLGVMLSPSAPHRLFA